MAEEKDVLLELHRRADALLGALRVEKEKPFDVACRKLRGGVIVCVAKKLIRPNLIDEIRYYEVGGSPIFVKGNPVDILKLKKEVGLV